MRAFILVFLLISATISTKGQVQGSNMHKDKIYFLTERIAGGDDLTALFSRGKVIMNKGCIRIESASGKASYAIVWPSGFNYKRVNKAVHILNNNNQTVAKVGDHIRVSGGEVSRLSLKDVTQGIPGHIQCMKPFWIANNDVVVIKP